MPLTDTSIRNARPTEKPVRIFDGGGLYVEISPAGGKLWRLKYRIDGKEKLLALGMYPDVGLKDARERRDEARKLLANGVDPGAHRKAQKAAKADRSGNSFEVICREWLEQRKDTVEPSQHVKTLARMENDVFPWLGAKAIAEITSPDVLGVLRRIDERGARYTAHRVRSEISRAFRYAIATGRADRDPCPDLKGAIPAPKAEHFAAITTPTEVAELLRAIDGFRGTFVVKSALLLAALTHDPAQSGSFAGSPAFAAGAVKSRGAGGRRARDTRVEWGPWRGCREVSGTPVRSLDEPFPARTMPYGGMLGPSWADHSSCSRKGSARSPRIRAESSQGAAQEVRMKRIAPRTPN
jgi:hypothetical protein